MKMRDDEKYMQSFFGFPKITTVKNLAFKIPVTV